MAELETGRRRGRRCRRHRRAPTVVRLNFLSHAYVARLEAGDDAEFVLGAMLPDLVGMAAARVPDDLPARVADGCLAHHRVDARFHDTPIFRAGVARLQLQLQDAGLRRGAGRGAAHVGYELLVDRALPWDAALASTLNAAFVAGAGIRGSFEAPHADRWALLVDRLVSADLDPRSSTMVELARRIEAVLGRRPRLALSPGDAVRIAEILGVEAAAVAVETPILLAGVAD